MSLVLFRTFGFPSPQYWPIVYASFGMAFVCSGALVGGNAAGVGAGGREVEVGDTVVVVPLVVVVAIDVEAEVEGAVPIVEIAADGVAPVVEIDPAVVGDGAD